ncbi:hypothetical protein HED60_10945 [Planctomycetales bacterium ZRK34]|nr:hypothetical protein HED60_10945 [Planctomycetales bacterium ZRK34]
MDCHDENLNASADECPRQCGQCNVCCTAMLVRPLDKPAGMRCAHQTDTGCGNYENRPSVCRTWYCMWVRDGAGIFTEEHRPDKLGVFFTATNPESAGDRQVIHVHQLYPGAADRREAVNVIHFLRQFVPVEIIPARGDIREAPIAPATLTHNGKAVA